jgi:beta-glucanase (GH16 family)
MCPDDNGWPPEVDLYDGTGTYMLKWWTSNNYPASGGGLDQEFDIDDGSKPVYESWHTLGMLWTANSVTAYYDDVRVPGVITYKTAQTNGFYWIFNLANHDNTAPPAQAPNDFLMQIDWVRTWKAATEVTNIPPAFVKSAVNPYFSNGIIRVTGQHEVEVADMAGRTCFAHRGDAAWTGPIGRLSKGIYILKMKQQSGIQVFPIAVQ